MKSPNRTALNFALGIALLLVQVSSNAQISSDNRIDNVLDDAPVLAKFGDFDIGVRTAVFADANRPDILNTVNGEETKVYNRALTVEIWYPAQLAPGQAPGSEYRAITRNPAITATLRGTAVRDAAPLETSSAFPLVIISHGYPGNRFLMSHLGESLASKGYVAVSIDHKDSTYDDQQAFGSTLYNRALDQRFVLQTIADLANDSSSFLYQMVDTSRTGVVGYSMGGYGLVNNLGGGYNDEIINDDGAPPNGLLGQHSTGNPDYRSNLDPRIKAGFAVAPWGMNAGFWRPSDLAGVNVPTFYLAGDADGVAGYENGVRAIYENAINSDRYLLTFEKAGHNAGAPIPLPIEIRDNADQTGATHYTDSEWDNVHMNNIMDHFATAFFDLHLKQDSSKQQYLSNPVSDNWTGFQPGTNAGLKLEFEAAD